MNAPGAEMTVQQQTLDWLFARLAGQPVPEPSAEASSAQDTGDHVDAVPAPEIRSEADLKLATAWIQRERARLEAYTRSQIGRIQQEHQALVGQGYLNEQSLILRSQELTRQEEVLRAQGQALREQAEELSRREQGLATQLQQWWQANEDLVAIQEATQSAQQDADQQKALASVLQAETKAMQQAREKARAELDSLLKATEDQRQARTREEAALKARQDQLEQRLLAAEKALLASAQRQAELDDLETRLHREFEEQECEMVAQRQVLAAMTAQFREEQSQWYEQVLAAQQAQEELAQKNAEIDQMKEYLNQCYADIEVQYEELERHRKAWEEYEQTVREELETQLGQGEEQPWPTEDQTPSPNTCPQAAPAVQKPAARLSGSHPGTSRWERWLKR